MVRKQLLPVASGQAEHVAGQLRHPAQPLRRQSGVPSVTYADAVVQEVLQVALGMAGIEPRAVAGLQLHGTATALGDPVEAGAALAVLWHPAKAATDAATTPAVALTMTALKSRVGHTEAAAGACGLLSSLCDLQQGLTGGPSPL